MISVYSQKNSTNALIMKMFSGEHLVHSEIKSGLKFYELRFVDLAKADLK